MSPKHQVFISSTHDDLIVERKAIIEQLLILDCIPASMEFFQPLNEKSLKIIEGVLENCDYLILIIAGRYGSFIDKKPESISFTEAEYNYATRHNIPVIPFLLDEYEWGRLKKSNKKIDKKKIDKELKKQKKLLSFRQKLEKEALVRYYTSESDLSKNVGGALNNAIKKKPRYGWIRNDQISIWNVISSATKKNQQSSKNYKEIVSLFKEGKGMLNKLSLAFPLTKRLFGKNKREVNAILQITNKSMNKDVKDAIKSKFYRRIPGTKMIELLPEWEYDLLYAMCYVSEHNLHNDKKPKEHPFDNINWLEPSWEDVAMYLSQICNEDGFNRATKILKTKMLNIHEKKHFERLVLIYRMVMSRPTVNTTLLENLFKEILSLQKNSNDN